MMEISSSARIWTIITFVVYSIICIILANVAGKKKESGGFGKSFYAGGGNMNWLAAGMMLASAACSGGTFLSNPGLAHSWGLMWPICMFFTVFGATIAGIIVNKKLKIVCGRINAVSLGAALKHRYGNNAFIGWYTPLSIMIFSGLFLYQQMTSGAKLMETVTGLPYIYGLLIFAVILLAYTLLSGAQGQSVVSVFQGAVMTITTIALVIGIMSHVNGTWGGLENAFHNLSETSPQTLSPVAGFSFLILGSFLFQTGVSGSIGSNNVAQATKLGSSKALHKSTIMTIVFVGFWSMVMPTLGTIAKTVFPDVASDSIIPYTAMIVLPPVFAGIVVSGVTAAIHSTLAFNLLTINSVVVMDLIDGQIMKGKANDKQLKTANTVVTVTLIVLMVLIAIKPPELIGVINNFSIAGGAAAFFIPMLFGVWWKKANVYGCISSMICGIGYYLLSSAVKTLTFGVNAIIPSLIVAAIAMMAVSSMTPRPSDEVIDIWFGVGKSTHKK